MYFNKSIIALLFIFLITGCTNDSASDLTEETPIVENVTYAKDVKPIIDANCIACHNAPPINGAPMPLMTYENVKQAVKVRGLIGRISRENGQAGLMPNGGPRLPQEKIDLIIRWQDQGFQE